MTPLRVGLVGAGPHVNDVIAPTLMSTPGLSLVAFGSTDPSAGELADAWGVEGVQAEVEEFLEVGEFDAAVLASHPADHEAALRVAPGLGLPLFVVGPPAFASAPIRAFDLANGERETRVTSCRGPVPPVRRDDAHRLRAHRRARPRRPRGHGLPRRPARARRCGAATSSTRSCSPAACTRSP